MPLRLCYNQSIYRIANGYSGRRSEILQSGVEIIGDTGVRGDLVCASTAIEALSSLGADFKLEIGNVGFYNALISELNLSESESAELRTNVEHKNLGKIAEYGKIASIPLLYGGREVLEKAAAIAGDNKAALDAVNYVGKIYDTLVSSGAADHVIIDMGLVHDIDYYTGLVFRGYMDGAGEPVLAGGRYDTLVSKFEKDIPATGFGVNISEVADTLIRSGKYSEKASEVKELVAFDTVSIAEALAYVKENAGAELSPLASKGENVEYARASGFSKLVCFENKTKTVFMI
jgi:ATP phosphoribosyltransferase regulatory subunit